VGEVVALERAGGVSNSRLGLKSETGFTVGDPGLDTVRLRFRSPEPVQERLREKGVVQGHARGELRRSSGGVTVGAFPDGMVYVEGRVASLFGTPESHALAPAAALHDVERIWRDSLDLVPETVCEVGRADVTGDLVFDDAERGLDLLAALRHMDTPWLKVGTEGYKRGELETVYGRSARGRSVQLRTYDAGKHHGTHEPGERIRFERQRHFRKAAARTVAQFAERPLGEWFVGRELAALVARDEDDVYVCNQDGAMRELRRLAHAEVITWSACERLCGFVWLRGQGQSRATRFRREAELRGLNIALDRTLRASSRVPVNACVRAVVESFAAAA
jgi:hypothetical protein